MKNKFLGMMGFARKSGNMSFGYEQVVEMIKKSKVQLVVIAEDISENRFKKIISVCETFEVQWIQYGTKEMLSNAIGQYNKSIFGVHDNNFAKQMVVYHNDMKN